MKQKSEAKKNYAKTWVKSDENEVKKLKQNKVKGNKKFILTSRNEKDAKRFLCHFDSLWSKKRSENGTLVDRCLRSVKSASF